MTAGGRFGGIGFYLLKGKPVFVYNFVNIERFRWEGKDAIGPGKHTLVFDFAYDGIGFGLGGRGTLKVDGKVADSKQIPKTMPLVFASQETAMKRTETGETGRRNPGRARLGAAAIVVALALGGCGLIEEGEAYIYGMESWVYGYPLVMMDVTRDVLTAAPAPNVDGTAAPINQLIGPSPRTPVMMPTLLHLPVDGWRCVGLACRAAECAGAVGTRGGR